MKKQSIYLMGLITLLVFPLPTFIWFHYFENTEPLELFQLEKFTVFNVVIGFQLGIVYAFLALLFMKAPVFDKLPNRIDRLIKGMNLRFIDCVFLSLCAGIGEEFLFRSGVQFYLGVPLTSIIFVAIHGYLNPINWRMSLYGLIVLPFILLIGYGLNEFGIWFCIAAHFAYDLILFLAIKSDD